MSHHNARICSMERRAGNVPIPTGRFGSYSQDVSPTLHGVDGKGGAVEGEDALALAHGTQGRGGGADAAAGPLAHGCLRACDVKY